jgi:hypothetical protein
MYNYLSDRYGLACLEQAKGGKSDVCFGAVLVKNDRILGRGRNRRATKTDRRNMSYVDYGIHAEQAAILDAIKRGHDPCDGTIYVLGFANGGPNKGKLTTRDKKIFICRKCPHALLQYNIDVCIPYVLGWERLTPKEAAFTGQQFSKDGYWKKFVSN